MLNDKNYKIGILYGTNPDTEMLAQKFAGNLINNEEFCKACELLEQHVKCDHCRENLKPYANSIYFYEQILGRMVSTPNSIFNRGMFPPGHKFVSAASSCKFRVGFTPAAVALTQPDEQNLGETPYDLTNGGTRRRGRRDPTLRSLGLHACALGLISF